MQRKPLFSLQPPPISHGVPGTPAPSFPAVMAVTHPRPVEKGMHKTASQPTTSSCRKMQDSRNVTDKLQQGMLMDISASVKALRTKMLPLTLHPPFCQCLNSFWIPFFLAVLLNKSLFSKLKKFIIRSFGISQCFSHLTHQARAAPWSLVQPLLNFRGHRTHTHTCAGFLEHCKQTALANHKGKTRH